MINQQHPRLARGETYTCGYKPYRCEVCNYSTTTKGNLSIHMQSDKHINNMQELQNNGGEAPTSPSPARAVISMLPPPAHPSHRIWIKRTSLTGGVISVIMKQTLLGISEYT